MIAVIAALAVGQIAGAATYEPVGPKIEVRVENRGAFVITTDPKASPKTVAHILKLVNDGFYNRQRFHRVENWVTQWGAPASKTESLDTDAVRSGGSGTKLPFEESKIDFTRGVVGVASTGLQVGGDSQLFVLKKDAIRLYRSYAVVGKVTQGMDVVDAITRGDRITSMREIKPVVRRRR